MLVDPDECAVDEDIFEIWIVAERLENPLPDPLLCPAPEARSGLSSMSLDAGQPAFGLGLQIVNPTPRLAVATDC
jgi:hypothetical protein